METITSWRNESLSELSNRNNHKVVKDTAGEYRWYHKLNGKWSIHSIKVFEDEATPLHWMHTWLSMWRNELDRRITKKASRDRRAKKSVLRSSKTSKQQKAILLSELLSEYTQQELANELQVSIATLKRYLKK